MCQIIGKLSGDTAVDEEGNGSLKSPLHTRGSLVSSSKGMILSLIRSRWPFSRKSTWSGNKLETISTKSDWNGGEPLSIGASKEILEKGAKATSALSQLKPLFDAYIYERFRQSNDFILCKGCILSLITPPSLETSRKWKPRGALLISTDFYLFEFEFDKKNGWTRIREFKFTFAENTRGFISDDFDDDTVVELRIDETKQDTEKLYLKCESLKERNEWIKYMKKVTAFIRNVPGRPPALTQYLLDNTEVFDYDEKSPIQISISPNDFVEAVKKNKLMNGRATVSDSSALTRMHCHQTC